MEIVLHVGAHRTATSALQRHIATHRKALAAAETAYWGPKVTRGGLFRRMSGSLDNALPWEAQRAAGRVALRLEKLRQDGHRRLLVSDENMIGSLRTVLEDTCLYPGAGQRVAEFARGFRGHRLTVGLGIRSYPQWWASALAFRLPRGGPMPRAGLRERMVTQPRRWRHVVQEIARALPDARVAVWTHEALSNLPDRVLHDLTGIETATSRLPPTNASPAAGDLRRLMSDCGADFDGSMWRGDRFTPFAPHESRALRAQYDEDLAWLAAGADGLADYVDAPLAETDALTVEGRGSSDDGDYRNLA